MTDPIYKTKEGQQVTKKQLLESGYSEDRITKGLANGILSQIGDTEARGQSFKTKDGQIVNYDQLINSGYSEERINNGIQNGILVASEEVKKKGGSLSVGGEISPTGTEDTAPSALTSEFQLGASAVPPKIKPLTDKERYEAIRNADAISLITQYDDRIEKQSTNVIENPFDFGKRKVDFEQSREGKVGKMLKDFQEGKANANDLNYVAKVAPKAAKEIIKSVLPTVSDNSLLQPEIIDAAIRESVKINIQKAKDLKVANNENIDSYITNQLSNFSDIEIDTDKVVDPSYSEQLIKDISAKEKEEISALNNEFPLKTVSGGAGGFAMGTSVAMARDNETEFQKRQSEIRHKYGQVMNMVGLKATYDVAKSDPTKDPLTLGETWAKIARPDDYKLWEQSNKRSSGLSRDMAQIGVNSLYGSGNTGAVELAFGDEKVLDDRYPESKKAKVLHRLGAELSKSSNWFINRAANVDQLDEAAKQLTQADREFYYKHIREEESRNIGTNVPMRGAANKAGEGAGKTLSGIVNYLERKAGAREDADVAYDALNSTYNTQYQNVGDYAPAVQRLKQLKDIPKSGKELTKEEIKEKEDLETYTGIRSGINKVVDGSFNLAGQVAVQALLTRGLGGLATRGVSGLGLLRTADAAAGLTGLEAVAANATNFGIATAPTVEKIIGGAIAYASSYDQAEQDAFRLMPDEKDADKRTIFTNTVGVLNAVTENIFRDSKILDAFNREISPNVRTLVNKLSAGEISQEALAPALTKLLKQSATFTKFATIENTKESFEEFSVSAGQSAATAILAPAKFNFNDAFNEAIGTFTSTFADGGIVASMAAIKGTRANNIGIRTFASLGVNKQLTEDANSYINAQLANGSITQDEYNEKKTIIDTAANINTQVMPEVSKLGTLSDKSYAKYSVQLLNERLLNEKVTDEKNAVSKDKALILKYENQIKESENIRTKLLDNEIFVGKDFSIKTEQEINQEIATDGKIQTTEEIETGLRGQLGEEKSNAAIAQVKELVDNELIPETVSEVDKQLAATNPLQFLQFVAQQAQGEIQLEGKTISSRENTLENFGGGIVAAAEDFFPKQEKIQESVFRTTEDVNKIFSETIPNNMRYAPIDITDVVTEKALVNKLAPGKQISVRAAVSTMKNRYETLQDLMVNCLTK